MEWTGVETGDRQPEGRTMLARGGLMLPGRIHKRFGKNTVHAMGLKELAGVWHAKKREYLIQK